MAALSPSESVAVKTAERSPATVGAKETSMVQLAAAISVPVQFVLEIMKSPTLNCDKSPEIDPSVTLSPVIVFAEVSVKVCVPLGEPTACWQYIKALSAGYDGVQTGDAGASITKVAPVPATLRKGTPANVSEASRNPAVVGEKAISNVQLCRP